jgi:hypothetical protein
MTPNVVVVTLPARCHVPDRPAFCHFCPHLCGCSACSPPSSVNNTISIFCASVRCGRSCCLRNTQPWLNQRLKVIRETGSIHHGIQLLSQGPGGNGPKVVVDLGGLVWHDDQSDVVNDACKETCPRTGRFERAHATRTTWCSVQAR